MRKRLLSLLLGCALLITLMPAAQAAVPDALQVALVVQPGETINPLRTRMRDPLNLLSLVYEGLMKLDDDRKPVYALADSYNTENGKNWIFHIREDAMFHNGAPVTAYDVCATLDKIWQIAGLNEENQSDIPIADRGVHCNLYAYIKAWEPVDENTVKITASRSYYGLLNAMTFPIFPASNIDDELPPGTGPYYIEEYLEDTRLWISAWYQWRDTPPAVTNIFGNFYETTDAALNAYEYMEADIAFSRSLTATRYSGTLSSFYLSYRTNQLEMLLMHQYGSVITSSDVVRKAISAAINVDSLIKNSYQNMALASPTTQMPGTWLNDSSLIADETLYPGYNPGYAAALLEADGWILTDDKTRYKTVGGEAKQLSLGLLTYDEVGSSVRRNAADSIADDLAAIGIKVTVRTSTYSDVQTRLKAGSFDLALCAYQMDVVPDPGFLLVSGNTSRYNSEIMRDLVTQMRKQYTETEYYSAMQEIARQQLMDVPFIPLYYRTGALLTRQSFTQARDVREGELLRGIEEWR